MDARALAVRDRIFDVVFDKGCLDALCAGCDQIALLRNWGRDITSKEDELSRAAAASVMQLLRQVERCLVPGGRYICVSYEGPSGRQHFFTAAAEAGLSLKLVQTAVEEESHNYVYIFVRGGTAASPPVSSGQAAHGMGLDSTADASPAATANGADTVIKVPDDPAAPKH